MPDRGQSQAVTALAVGALTAGSLVLVLVLLLTGGAPPSTPGPSGPGPVVTWALHLTPYSVNVVAVVTVGFAALGGRYLGVAADTRVHARANRTAGVAAIAWVALSLLTVLLLALQLRAVTGAVDMLPDSVQVRALLLQATAAGVAAVTAWRGSWLALPFALAALAPDLLAGHARTADSPLLAGAAVVVHVVAVSLWVGGLVAVGWLALRHRDAWATVLPRYSALALGCVGVLAASGVVAAVGRIESWGQLLSGYGVVVLLKSSALLVLVLVGATQRREVVRRGSRARHRDVLLLAAGELTLMTLVLALGTGLAQTPPPG